jgi:hypothetical protein
MVCHLVAAASAASLLAAKSGVSRASSACSSGSIHNASGFNGALCRHISSVGRPSEAGRRRMRSRTATSWPLFSVADRPAAHCAWIRNEAFASGRPNHGRLWSSLELDARRADGRRAGHGYLGGAFKLRTKNNNSNNDNNNNEGGRQHTAQWFGHANGHRERRGRRCFLVPSAGAETHNSRAGRRRHGRASERRQDGPKVCETERRAASWPTDDNASCPAGVVRLAVASTSAAAGCE